MKFAYTIIYVSDVELTLKFYTQAFGCTIRFLHESKCYGELETGNVVLAFASESLATDNIGIFKKNRPGKEASGFEIAFTTSDVTRAYHQAVELGATSLKSPIEKPWGQLVAYVVDINGIIVEICSPLL